MATGTGGMSSIVGASCRESSGGDVMESARSMYWGAGGLVCFMTSGVEGGDGDGGFGGSDSAVVGAGAIPWSITGWLGCMPSGNDGCVVLVSQTHQP